MSKSEAYYIESISKLFIYEFPTIIDIDKVPNYTYSISDFSDEEKLFYEKYVGCYIPERELSKEYLSSHLSEVQVNFIENGIVFWGFCKLKAGIRYLEKEKQFFEYETFSGMPIKNVSEFKLSDFYEQNGYKKITDCEIVNNIISEKKEKMNRLPLTTLQEEKIRNLLSEFFIKLNKNEFDEIIDKFFTTSINDKGKIKDTLESQAIDLGCQNSNFDIYINVFFNDDIEKFDEDTIFVEFKYPHPINYVSFALKEINSELKILNYIARYDGE